jgi:CRISPR-associated protein Csm2
MNVLEFRIEYLESKKVHRSGSKELRKEQEFLERSFHSWGIQPTGAVILDENTLHKIITSADTSEEESARLLVEWADRLGAIFKSTKLSSSQLREFFGTARTIQQQGFDSAKSHRQFILLLPKLQYAAKRANTMGMEGLRDVLSCAIRYVNNDALRFRRFMEFFEAILAYHKAYGGS